MSCSAIAPTPVIAKVFWFVFSKKELLALLFFAAYTPGHPCRGTWLCPGYAHFRATSHRDQNMPLYECVLIARNDVTQQQVEAVADTVAAQLETDGGTIQKREYWGLRSLSYRIKKNRKGHYMLLGLDAPPSSVSEIERQLGLNEDILRFMTIRVDAIDENPSAILARKSDDRERTFRGPKPAGRFESGRKRGYDDREEFRARDLNDSIEE
jgi:small subunit ribosomal protein S6